MVRKPVTESWSISSVSTGGGDVDFTTDVLFVSLVLQKRPTNIVLFCGKDLGIGSLLKAVY